MSVKTKNCGYPQTRGSRSTPRSLVRTSSRYASGRLMSAETKLCNYCKILADTCQLRRFLLGDRFGWGWGGFHRRFRRGLRDDRSFGDNCRRFFRYRSDRFGRYRLGGSRN